MLVNNIISNQEKLIGRALYTIEIEHDLWHCNDDYQLRDQQQLHYSQFSMYGSRTHLVE